jgi:hypothetical protein
MRGDKAFWQLLYLIFCKIHDETLTKRKFFVGATEGNDEAGRQRVVKRIQELLYLISAPSSNGTGQPSYRLPVCPRTLAVPPPWLKSSRGWYPPPSNL